MKLVGLSMLSLPGMLLAAADVPTTVSKGSANSAKVTNILVQTGGDRAFFYVDRAITATPACNAAGRFVIDLSTNGGRAMLSLVMSAQAQRANVIVHGSNNCTLHGDSEQALWVLAETPAG